MKINNKVKSIFVLAICLFLSCRVTFLPSYDEKLYAQIEETAKSVDILYLTMLEKDGKSYIKYVDNYVLIQAELASILAKNKIRPQNKSSVRICEITLEKWIKYKNEHRDTNGGLINRGQIESNKQLFKQLFEAMLIEEKAKELIKGESK